MATSKRDELAKRFADRLQQAPTRGTVDHTHRSRRAGEPLGRGAAGARLRGHLVPHSVHADARRVKLSEQARRGTRFTWDDVVAEALELLFAQRPNIAERMAEVRRLAHDATAGPRLVQATILLDVDQRLGELRLDLSDELGHDVSYEHLWAAALLIWIGEYR
jgi:hypothetical protein